MARKKAKQLYIKKKIRRCFVIPALHGLLRRDGVETGVDLDVIEMPGIPAKTCRRWQSPRVPVSDKAGVRPTCGADADHRDGLPAEGRPVQLTLATFCCTCNKRLHTRSPVIAGRGNPNPGDIVSFARESACREDLGPQTAVSF